MGLAVGAGGRPGRRLRFRKPEAPVDGDAGNSNMAQTIDPELLDILVCPLSHAPLALVGDWLYSTDPVTRRRYPVRDGIPIMLIDESEVVDEAEFKKIVQQRQE